MSMERRASASWVFAIIRRIGISLGLCKKKVVFHTVILKFLKFEYSSSLCLHSKFPYFSVNIPYQWEFKKRSDYIIMISEMCWNLLFKLEQDLAFGIIIENRIWTFLIKDLIISYHFSSQT